MSLNIMQSQLTPLMTPPTTEVKFIRNLISSILPFHWTFTRWSLPTVNYGTARHSLRQIFYPPSLQRSRKCVAAAVLLHWRDDRSIVHCFVPQEEEEAARWLATMMTALFAFANYHLGNVADMFYGLLSDYLRGHFKNLNPCLFALQT